MYFGKIINQILFFDLLSYVNLSSIVNLLVLYKKVLDDSIRFQKITNGSRKLSMVQNGYSEDFESSGTSGAPYLLPIVKGTYLLIAIFLYTRTQYSMK